MRAIVFDCCDYGFDCFLTEFLGAMFGALVEELAGIGALATSRSAGIDGCGQIVDRETRHTGYSKSPAEKPALSAYVAFLRRGVVRHPGAWVARAGTCALWLRGW